MEKNPYLRDAKPPLGQRHGPRVLLIPAGIFAVAALVAWYNVAVFLALFLSVTAWGLFELYLWIGKAP